VGPTGLILGAAGISDPRGLSAQSSPRFVRVDLTGNVYVSDGDNPWVSVYDSRLRSVSDLSPPYSALALPHGSISGLAMDAFGEFYMADRLNGKVYRFDAGGRFVSDFDGGDAPWARLGRPQGIACGPIDGAVYVCDPGQRRVVVFDNSGVALRSFGENELREPEAVAVNRHGQCLVADSELRAILVFSRQGRYVGRIDGQRIGFADFGGPTDVAVGDSTLYVADPSNGRVLRIRFRSSSQSP
jgi:DNA-binding beta-propeller fold protein YncE